VFFAYFFLPLSKIRKISHPHLLLKRGYPSSFCGYFSTMHSLNMNMKKTTTPNTTPSQAESDQFCKLFDQYFERLFVFARRMVKSEEAAKDVVSEVFLACWKNASHVLEMADIRSYLYTSTRHECFRYLRKQLPLHSPDFSNTSEEAYLLAIENFTPEDALLFEELQQVIEQAIEALPPQCKAVYKLVKEDGLTHEEAAKVMNTSPNTVKNQVVKALGVARKAVVHYMIAKDNLPGKSSQKVAYGLSLIAICLLA
jgi:RNA polymerase sigma-70 factor (ECF subfamily)